MEHERIKMAKEIISTENAPAAVGPYSQAVRVGSLVFTAGQVAIDPATGQMVGDDAAAQAEQVLKNISAVLEAAGTSLDNVVKATVFLDNMDDYAGVNEVYARFFTTNPPARSAVEVARLPRNALVEIETIAVIG
jgi:2-iminobutanoate/2-iminopropanoate deaminase